MKDDAQPWARACDREMVPDDDYARNLAFNLSQLSRDRRRRESERGLFAGREM